MILDPPKNGSWKTTLLILTSSVPAHTTILTNSVQRDLYTNDKLSANMTFILTSSLPILPLHYRQVQCQYDLYINDRQVQCQYYLYIKDRFSANMTFTLTGSVSDLYINLYINNRFSANTTFTLTTSSVPTGPLQ